MLWCVLVLVRCSTLVSASLSPLEVRPEAPWVAPLAARLTQGGWGPCRGFLALVALHPDLADQGLRVLQRVEPSCPRTITPMLRGPSHNSLWPRKINNILIITQDIEDFLIFLDFASEDDAWNPRAKVVLVLSPPIPVSSVQQLLNATWSRRYQLFHTVVVSRFSALSPPEVLTLLPQPHPACHLPRLVSLPAGPLFPRKLSNLGGCELRVSNTFVPPYFFSPSRGPSQGVNAQMLHVLANKLNFTPVLEPPTRPGAMSDNLYLQTITNVLNNDVDILPFPLSQDIGEFCYIFGWTGISAAVPKADYIPVWMNLIIPFSKEVWFAALLLLLIETGLQFLLLPGSFWPALTSKLSASSGSLRVTSSQLSSRLFLSNMLLTGMVLTAAYQSALYQGLTLARRHPDINTLDELLDSDLPLVGYKVIKYYITLGNDTKYNRMLDKFVVSSNDPSTELHNLVKYRNFSYTCDSLLLQYTQKVMFIKEKLDFHIIDKYASVLNSFIVPFGSLYADEFNSVIKKVMQSGIYYKWERDLMKMKTLESKIISNVNLTVKHLTSAFLALCIGLACSLVVFLCEMLVHKVL